VVRLRSSFYPHQACQQGRSVQSGRRCSRCVKKQRAPQQQEHVPLGVVEQDLPLCPVLPPCRASQTYMLLFLYYITRANQLLVLSTQPHLPAHPKHADARSRAQQRPSPAEISQRSVDLLLSEYYKMVKSSQSGSGGSGARLSVAGAGSGGSGAGCGVFVETLRALKFEPRHTRTRNAPSIQPTPPSSAHQHPPPPRRPWCTAACAAHPAVPLPARLFGVGCADQVHRGSSQRHRAPCGERDWGGCAWEIFRVSPMHQ